MRSLLQRVSSAEVRLQEDGTVLGRIGPGLLVLLGLAQGDGDKEATWMVDKILGLRIFPDQPGAGNMNRALEDGGLLIVSQFTLLADCRKGRRPSFTAAMVPTEAQVLYERFLALCRQRCKNVASGRFGAMMDVALVNDGPVTIWLDTATP